jgi:hypothetical protein
MDVAFIEAAQGVIETLPSEFGGLADQYHGRPARGSQAEREIESFSDAEAVRTAYSQSALALDSVADHLDALRRATTEPVDVFASFSLARGILTSAAIAEWLSDGNISTTDRVGRSMSFRYEGIRQQRTLLNLKGSEEELQRVEGRLTAIVMDAARRGVPTSEDESGHAQKLTRKVPPDTKLAASSLQAEWQYRLLSAVSHGHSWALRATGFQQSADVPHGFVTRDASPLIIGSLLHWSIEWFLRPAWSQAILMGWLLRDLAKASEAAYDRLGFPPSQRFWRRSPKINQLI